MADTVSGEQNPFEAWSKLIESTMKGYSAGQPLARPSQGNEKDPWIVQIDQLWKANPYSKLLPIDPAEITLAFQQIWFDSVRHPDRAWATYSDFVQQSTQSMTTAALKFWGGDQDAKSVVEPEKGDKRFSAPDWQQNPIFDALKQSYLLTATTLLKTASEIEGLDEHLASGPVRFILGGSGHIAGIINPPSKGKGYWTNEKPVKTADEWLESAEQHKGSWWADWLEWLRPRSSEQGAPPSMGSTAHPPIMPAPGTYVLEK